MREDATPPRPEGSASQPGARPEPTGTHLRLDRHRVRPGLEFCAPIGEIDLTTAPLLRRALADCERREVSQVVVDLSRVSFLAVVGARVLATAAARAREHQQRLCLMRAGRPVRRVLELTGFGEHLTSYSRLPAELAPCTTTASAVHERWPGAARNHCTHRRRWPGSPGKR